MIKKLFLAFFVLAIIVVALGVGLGIGLKRNSTEYVRHSGSVVSNGEECAAIGG